MNIASDSAGRWTLAQQDCIEHMAEMKPESMDCAIFSPPFPALFAYTGEACDIGNVGDLRHEIKIHFSYLFRGLCRVMKPGRVVMVHCMQIPALLRSGEKDTSDFRGILIRMARRAGLRYITDWPVTKNPQAQAIRTHSHKLLFVTLERDRAQSAPAFQDFLIKFVVPGDNPVPIDSSEISRNEWIDWAEGVWDWRTIRETDTLNTRSAKGEGDTKHICPLQLPVIARLVKMFTNPGETVFSPFAGIGSELYQSILLGRRGYGCEIKDEYFAEAQENCRRALAIEATRNKTLFDDLEHGDIPQQVVA